MEVALQLAPGHVRCVALEATDGLAVGTGVEYLGPGIEVPVGDEMLGQCGRCNWAADLTGLERLRHMTDV